MRLEEEGRKLDPSLRRLSRHYLAPGQARTVLTLAISVIEAAISTRLVTSIRGAAALDPSREPASPSAVPVPAVARLADREGRPAPPARQQVQDDSSQ